MPVSGLARLMAAPAWRDKSRNKGQASLPLATILISPAAMSSPAPCPDPIMAARLALHIGMRKTGSTALQHAFAGYDNEHALYPELLGYRYHTEPLLCFFHKRWRLLVKDRIEMGRGDGSLTRSDVSVALKQAAREAGENRTLILSSEALSERLTEHDVNKLKGWSERFYRDAVVIGYVRSPLSFANSAFQQSLMASRDARFAVQVYDYAGNFEHWFDIFGEDKVTLQHFSRSALVDGDIVKDFAAKLDIEAPKSRVLHHAQSLETNALLYAFTRQFAGGDALDMRLAKKLLLKNCRFEDAPPMRLSQDLVRKQLGEETLAWAKKRMGPEFLDEDDSDANVHSREDLIAADPGWHRGLKVCIRDRKTPSSVREMIKTFAQTRSPNPGNLPEVRPSFAEAGEG